MSELLQCHDDCSWRGSSPRRPCTHQVARLHNRACEQNIVTDPAFADSINVSVSTNIDFIIYNQLGVFSRTTQLAIVRNGFITTLSTGTMFR